MNCCVPNCSDLEGSLPLQGDKKNTLGALTPDDPLPRRKVTQPSSLTEATKQNLNMESFRRRALRQGKSSSDAAPSAVT